MVTSRWGWGAVWSTLALIAVGCADNPAKLRYLGDAALNYYKEAATEVDYAAVDSYTAGEVLTTEKPRAVNDRREDEIRDLTLQEAIQIALQNSVIIRSTTQLATPANGILSGPDRLSSIYDPAIQESGVLFGGRGLESALSAFDARWITSMTWGRNEQNPNNPFLAGGLTSGTFVQETGNFSTRLQKIFADGGSFAVTHDWNYTGSNAPMQLFPSAYAGSVGAEYRLPLLAGAGTEFTRIAGPIATSFGGLTGVNQGVVITRINNDITLADFELSVRNLMKDVEDTYWDLYLQYRLYDTAVTARNSTLDIWRQLKATADVGGKEGFKKTDLLQAREQYFETRAAAKSALGNIYRTEVQLRRLLGLPSNDGQIIRPSDEPPLAELIPNWELSLAEAITNRTELRRQKFNIKSLELQLKAAQSLTRPRLDFLSQYRVNGFGDQLLDYNDDDVRGTPQGLNSAYETITQGNETGWTLGFEMSMDLGFRSAHAQVRNIELRLAKARDTLAAQEMDISHELSVSFQDLATTYATAQANFNRTRSAQERVEMFQKRFEIETPDLILRAQLSRAQAEAEFYRSMNGYVKSIASFHYAKGDLLEYNNVHLAESMWTPGAYDQALRRALARSHAIGNPFLHAEPEEFVYPGSAHTVTLDDPSGELPTPDWEQLPGEYPDMSHPTPVEPSPATPPVPTPAPPANPYEPPDLLPPGDATSFHPKTMTGTKFGTLKPTTEEPSSIPRNAVRQVEYFEATPSDAFETIELDAANDLLN